MTPAFMAERNTMTQQIGNNIVAGAATGVLALNSSFIDL